MEKLRARAVCTNMFNKEVVFILWGDDANKEGHNSANKLIDTKKTKIDKNGIAICEFVLSKALMKKAMQGETNPKQLEFYVTVEYYKDKKHATDNININNPFPQAQRPPAKPGTIPKAKGSPAAAKPASKKEEAGILENIKGWWHDFDLWDWGESSGTIKKEQKPTMQKSDGKSLYEVNPSKGQEKKGTCICKQYDLIWGGHPNVSCEFRKKVVEICLDLWGEENKIKMANNLMAVFRWESGGTFKPDVPNQANSGGTGLIQFMPSTAKGLLGKEVNVEIVKNYFGKKYNKKLNKRKIGI